METQLPSRCGVGWGDTEGGVGALDGGGAAAWSYHLTVSACPPQLAGPHLPLPNCPHSLPLCHLPQVSLSALANSSAPVVTSVLKDVGTAAGASGLRGVTFDDIAVTSLPATSSTPGAPLVGVYAPKEVSSWLGSKYVPREPPSGGVAVLGPVWTLPCSLFTVHVPSCALRPARCMPLSFLIP